MEKIKSDILRILEEGTVEGNLYKLPEGKLDRKVYLDVNKVLSLLGGKWNSKKKAHVFSKDIGDVIDNAMIAGEVCDIKKELQFFPTPPKVVSKLWELAEIGKSMACLEPSAGKGDIAKMLAGVVGKGLVACCDIHKEFVDGLREDGFLVCYGDFLLQKGSNKYNRIVMNPPFTKQQDVDHVIHALDFLEPKGILVSVMSPGITFRGNKKTTNFWKVLDESYTYETIELPKDAFKVSGTGIASIIIKIKKKEDK